MTEKEQVQQIVKKYNKSIADLSENASAKEFKTDFSSYLMQLY
ncbi:hypothetical protein EfmAA818_17340 [Enterococcus faecium]|nr:hypothetical protein EfmAA818_17340 [Enterococcus faecium]